MKSIERIFVLIVVIILIIPLIFFNFQSPSISEIDNRNLTELDFASGNNANMLDAYIKDRIGFRSKMIQVNTTLNDKMFGIMEHPTYTYGKDGYVFFKMNSETVDEEFLTAFVDHLKKVQTYTEERGVPFLFVLNPGKIAVYSDKLPDGYVFQNKVIETIEQKLIENEINYVSNYDELVSRKDEQIFNVKYDAGHWNDLGAFYGTNNILNTIHELFPSVEPNTLDDFNIDYINQTSLHVSEFKIDEDVVEFNLKNDNHLVNSVDEYSSLILNQNYKAFFNFNGSEASELPNAMVFQGSYLNGRNKYMKNKFSNYTTIHNYENFIDFDYYFNIFKPDIVIMETADYALTSGYFNLEHLRTKEVNHFASESQIAKAKNLSSFEYSTSEEGNLLTITLDEHYENSSLYLISGDEQFDFINIAGKYQCTIDKTKISSDDFKVLIIDNE